MLHRIVGLLPALMLLFSGMVQAASDQPYESLPTPQPTANPDKIEVLEVFWYGCPHCYRLQPFMERWLRNKPANVDYQRLPAILRPSWAIHARAYFAAEILGVADKIHRPLFDALHAQRRRLNDPQSLEDFFAEHGVDRDTFRQTFNSFAVETKVRKARILMQRYGISGTPTIIVNGKYRTDGVMTGSFPNLMQVVDQLVQKESSATR